MDFGSALSDKDVAGEDKLSVGSLGTKTLRLAVATVLGGTDSFFMSKKIFENSKKFKKRSLQTRIYVL